MEESKEKITVEQLINLPKDIMKQYENLENSPKRFLKLLSKDACKLYYYTDLKKDLLIHFNRFSDLKYTLNYNADNCVSNYELKENKLLHSNYSKVEKLVERRMKDEVFALEMYNKITRLIKKLTYNEAFYFVESFLGKETDENISYKLGMSRNGLQPTRKSCLVKMYIEFLQQK